MEQKTERIKFWLSDEELRQIQRQAKQAGMNRSEYIRHLISDSAMIYTPDIEYDKYYSEFKNLGDSFNRCLKALHVTGIFQEKNADTVCRRILALQQQLYGELTEKLDAEIQKAKGGKP